MVDDYLMTNRQLWDERAPAHAASPDYGLDRFIADSGHLSDVVRFDRQRLGEPRSRMAPTPHLIGARR